MTSLLLIALAGFAAQLVDGGLGMGFGATSMTILTTFVALAPATASAVVNTAQLGTTVVSGFSHWRFDNVNWRVVATIGIPGAVASFIGATFLSHLSLAAATPITAAILAGIGIYLLLRFSRGSAPRPRRTDAHSPVLLSSLGLVGGFISATGGAGWGPVTTSALLSDGRMTPRRVVGTVNTAEVLVTVAAVIAFIIGLWEELSQHLAIALALLIGGAVAAPLAAWLVSRLNATLLGGLVGTLLVVLNVPKLLALLGVEGVAAAAIRAAILVAGVALSAKGARRATLIDASLTTPSPDSPSTLAEADEVSARSRK